jgi:gingipain R
MKRRIIIIILNTIIWGAAFTGSLQASSKISMVNENRDPSQIELLFQLGDYAIRPQWVNGRRCDFIELKGRHSAHPLEKGKPSLPYAVRSIIIPPDARMVLEVAEVKYKEIEVRRIVPSRGAIPLNRDPSEIPYQFGDVYTQDKWYPENAARLGRPYILRNYRGQAVYFHPFTYNPAWGILRAAESITVKIKPGGVSTVNTLDVPGSKKKVPHVFERIYKNHFINFDIQRKQTQYPAITEVGNMIVITTEEYRAAVEPLKEWKNRKGIKTDLYIYPTDTGNSAARIKAFIQNIYDTREGLAYILIVGDADDVPPGRGYSAGAGGIASDPVYTLLAGDDDYADAMIGRFSVGNITEAQTVVNKNLWYEMTPDPEGEWYHKTAGIACDDRYFTPNPRELMDEIREMLMGYHYTEFTAIYEPEARTHHIHEAVNQGRGLINANFHGTRSGWVRWIGSMDYLFNMTEVNRLQNAYKTPVVIAGSCETGDFTERTCFAETWQRLGSPREPKGSIVFLGASSAIWHLAWVAMEEMNYHLVNENYFTAGGIIFNGVMKMIDLFPGGPNYEGPETFQLWHIFGDPSLFIYTDTPTEMDVACENTLLTGSDSLTVFVSANRKPIKNALAAIYKNRTLYGSAYTDESGNAAVIFSKPLQETGTMELNVTAANKMPYFGSVKVRQGRKKSAHRSAKTK